MCVKKTFLKLIQPLVQYKATSFLGEKHIAETMERNLAKKLSKLKNCNIGKELGVASGTSIDDIPLTGYGFYHPFFMDPCEGDFMYPLNDYFKTMTSGTMSKPKAYLVPRKGLRKIIMSTGLSLIYISTFDGEKYGFSFGDTFYVNIPGGSFISNITSKELARGSSDLIHVVPENRDNMSFQEKVDYFVEHHHEIDIAQMNITTLLDDIKPRVRDKIQLKAFLTMDASAMQLKERVYETVGSYPKTPYGSTESIASTIPSIEHPGGFFFDWRTIYPEFIPEEYSVSTQVTRIDVPPEIVKLNEVELGERYQLVITPFHTDLTRNVTSDILECISFWDSQLKVETPIFSFYSRADKLISLHNFTRINEDEILHILEESSVPFVDFTARRELDGSREYMRLYIEFNEDVNLSEVEESIHGSFMEFDKDYQDLTRMMEYSPLRITRLPEGSFRDYLSKKEGMSRIARIDMREDRLKLLLSGL